VNLPGGIDVIVDERVPPDRWYVVVPVECPRCLTMVLPRRVHGHEECPACRFVWPCCSGEDD
jgi:hypothetical protein